MSNKEFEANYIWSSDSETNASTSAGAFYLIAKEFLHTHEGEAAVYGCGFDQDNNVKHIRIDKKNDLVRLQGSKYVQSDTSGIYKKVLEDLKNEYFVLFSGTACQTAAVYRFAGNYASRLYTIDILCHGVPSPALWKEYVNRLEAKYDGKISGIKFRNKSKSNRLGYLLRFKVNGKDKTIYPDESSYYKAFLNGTSLRPCCYVCPFIGDYKYADVTIGDSNDKTFHPSEAISLVLIRTEKGRQLYSMISHLTESTKANYQLEQNTNKKLIQATKRPKQRDTFYENSEKVLIDKVSSTILIKNRLKSLVSTSLKDTVRRMMMR